MQSASGEQSLGSDFLLDLPRESLVSIIRQMSGQLSQLRSQLTVLEQRNCMLQDRLPELIRGTIRSAMSAEGSKDAVDDCQMSVKNEEKGTARVSEGGDAVIPPVGLLTLPSTLAPPPTSLPPESSVVLKFLNTFLPLPTAEAPSPVPTQLPVTVPQNTGIDTSDMVKLTPLPPLSSLEEDGEEEGEDCLTSAVSRPRRTRTRTETTSLLSEEVIQQIEEQILSSMTERRERFWQIFLESKGWTRATCALMSCLFTRWQMAHSTVYGRQSPVGGEARDPLPTRLVHYIVTKINRRFGVNPVKVRARMAQKCKDLRRLIRKYGEDAVAVEGAAAVSTVTNGRGEAETEDTKAHCLDLGTSHTSVSFVPLHSSLPPLPNITFPPTS
ncbi:hypothetical protein ECG_07099 [Echinococcus granulosus]|uniref:BEN domain n=1 Tax=Echinococcus granulosus TaxID=6210 RepID=A0A068WWT9_ECHGR|nr:hypothetical protein ECG_07099 [Echinococcus granulosus]CDS22934.1 BEN domain [Echinococcus granulosus]